MVYALELARRCSKEQELSYRELEYVHSVRAKSSLAVNAGSDWAVSWLALQRWVFFADEVCDAKNTSQYS